MRGESAASELVFTFQRREINFLLPGIKSLIVQLLA
jgi:hypothetical protein